LVLLLVFIYTGKYRHKSRAKYVVVSALLSILHSCNIFYWSAGTATARQMLILANSSSKDVLDVANQSTLLRKPSLLGRSGTKCA